MSGKLNLFLLLLLTCILLEMGNMVKRIFVTQRYKFKGISKNLNKKKTLIYTGAIKEKINKEEEANFSNFGKNKLINL